MILFMLHSASRIDFSPKFQIILNSIELSIIIILTYFSIIFYLSTTCLFFFLLKFNLYCLRYLADVQEEPFVVASLENITDELAMWNSMFPGIKPTFCELIKYLQYEKELQLISS